MRRAAGTCSAALALALALLALQLGPSWSKDWADHWCEINDCKGLKAAEVKDEKVEAHSKEVRIATRRYYATGEIRAIKSEHVKAAFFQYDGCVRVWSRAASALACDAGGRVCVRERACPMPGRVTARRPSAVLALDAGCG